MHIAGSRDGEVFLNYVRRVLVPELRPGAVVVMDNLSSRKVAAVEEAIQAVGACLRYLPPPCSPDPNPIEQQARSRLKAHLRSCAGAHPPCFGPRHRHRTRTYHPQRYPRLFQKCGY